MADEVTLYDLAVRHIERDDLLHLAAEASEAVGILEADSLADVSIGRPADTYVAAMERHLRNARCTNDWPFRVQSHQHAAVLARFCLMLAEHGVAVHLPDGVDTVELYDRAAGTLGDRDLTVEVVAAYRAIRDLRITGDYRTAVERADRSPESFNGTGAEMYRGQIELERVFAYVRAGELERAEASIAESQEYWKRDARRLPTRGRYEQAWAIARLAQGDVPGAMQHLAEAAGYLRRYLDEQLDGQIEQLSVLVTRAECAAFGEQPDAEAVVAACLAALDGFEAIRHRWAVIARSPSPLALVLRLVLGDLARVLATVPGTARARLGLRLSLAAKHSGFAELIRTQRAVLDSHTADLLRDIVDVEQQLAAMAVTAPGRPRAEQTLAELRTEVEGSVSQVLADLVLPHRVDVDAVLATFGERVVIDFVALPTTDKHRWWYRTTVYGPDDIDFARLIPGEGYDALFKNGVRISTPASARTVGLLDRLSRSAVSDHPGWRLAAQELLPYRLLAELVDSDEVPEIVISPHRELSRVPWAALRVGEAGRRLVECALLVQTPLLTSYTGEEPAAVTGPALVRIDDAATGGGLEKLAWGIRSDGRAAMTLAECTVPPQQLTPLEGSLPEQLAAGEDRWRFLYVTTHGDRGTPVSGTVSGFQQRLALPEGDVTAGQALRLPWPESVMLNVCHAGAVSDDDDAEPMGFVIAAMSRGARCFVGALLPLLTSDNTARVGAQVVASLDGRTPLHRLLRVAQLQLVDQHLGEWAPLVAYVR